MNVLIIGNGGREHAIAWRLAQSESVEHIYVAPGNGGTACISPKVSNVPDLDGSPKSFGDLAAFAEKHRITFAVPGPEQPLVVGISAAFAGVGVPVFGPCALAARMEGLKAFSKHFMDKHSIPTARFHVFNNVTEAIAHVKSVDYPIVLKADGIAAGKGVLIPTTTEEALAGLDEIMVTRAFGSAGDEIVIEEFLEGDELSILTFTDGFSFYNLPAAQDHKRIGNGDTGLNTGGMGAYAPAPIATPSLLKTIDDRIIRPTIDGMRKDGYPMCGVLFTGIMVLPQGEPRVLEYNVRFGDPETQTVLPLLLPETDLAEVMLACARHCLDSVTISTRSDTFAATVVMAAGGYPEAYKKGDTLSVGEVGSDTYIFHAGTTFTGDKFVTNGGRVIASTAIASSLRLAVDKAYAGADAVQFDKKYCRRDIAHRAFKASEKTKNSGITYADAGVSVDNGNLLVEQIKQKVKLTARPGADSDIGGFGGLFDLSAAGYNTAETLLVAATDGVGTKLRIAQIMDIHNTVGIDLVAMNVNDLVVQGAEPLIFLDYFATGKLDISVASKFVEGVANGCIQAGCALVGGETLEMPGMYDEGHYDTNGTAVGAVLRNSILPKVLEMAAGNVLIGLALDGIHSNGFSLVRRIIDVSDYEYTSVAPWLPSGKTIGEEVLVPTKIYVKQLLPSLRDGKVLGLAHITGGGLVENIPRALPLHLQAVVDMNTWLIPPIFKWFGKEGNVPVSDILKTFNMGIGMVLIVEEANVSTVLSNLERENEKAFVIGELRAWENQVGAQCIVENSTGLY